MFSILLLLVLTLPPDLPADAVPGDGLGLSTNQPPPPVAARSVGSPALPIPVPTPAGLGGLGAAAAATALALSGGRVSRRRTDDSPADTAYDGDLRDVLGLEPGEEVVHFVPGHDGRVAVWVGPRDARYVAVLVPGTGADLSATHEQLVRARSLRDAAVAELGGAHDVAVVYALAFDAPDHVLTPNIWSEDCACNPDKAFAGGAELTDLVDDLDLDGRYVTVIGHSYGSTVVGSAFLHAGLGRFADTAVFLGSPGVFADSAGELGVRGEVYAGQADLDPINLTGFLGLISILPHTGPEEMVFGTDPTAASFGAKPVPTGGRGHDSYFTDSTSLRSLGRIIVDLEPQLVAGSW